MPIICTSMSHSLGMTNIYFHKMGSHDDISLPIFRINVYRWTSKWIFKNPFEQVKNCSLLIQEALSCLFWTNINSLVVTIQMTESHSFETFCLIYQGTTTFIGVMQLPKRYIKAQRMRFPTINGSLTFAT